MRDFSKRSRLVLVGAVWLAILLSAAPVAAVTWVKTTLADAANLDLQDAAFQGHNAAAVWQAPGPVTRFRTSTDNGMTFGTTRTVEPGHHTRQASSQLCGNDLYVAFAEDFSQPSTPNLWLIYVVRDTTAGVNHEYSLAYQDQAAIGRYPDVACTAAGLWVSWEQKVGSQWHVFVNRAARSHASFDNAPTDLGLLGSNAGKPVIAAAGSHAYVAWPTPGGTIRIHRWSDAAGVVDLGERQLAPGSAEVGAGVPVIATIGGKVAVAWFACGDLRARVSNDHGATWGSIRTLFPSACGSEFGGVPSSVAVDGSRILVAYHWFSGFHQKQRMISTTNDFGSFSDHLAYAASDLLVLGFVHPGGSTKIAGVVDEGTRQRFLRQP